MSIWQAIAAEDLALAQAAQVICLWSDKAFAEISPLALIDGQVILRPDVAGIIRAGYARAYAGRRAGCVACVSLGGAAVKEADLYPDLKAYLEAQGYVVKAEIGACDILARRGRRACGGGRDEAVVFAGVGDAGRGAAGAV